MLSILNLISWFRALSFLRFFKSTRVLIRLIVEVVIDMIPFMVVLMFMLLAFSLSFSALTDSNTNFLTDLGGNYRIMYGDFDLDSYDAALWVLFILASLIMPLVMLNLLIAIMSDTYDRIMQDI